MVATVRDPNVPFPASVVHLDTGQANAAASFASLGRVRSSGGGTIPRSRHEPPIPSRLRSQLPPRSGRLHAATQGAAEIFSLADIHYFLSLGIYDPSNNGSGMGALSDSRSLHAILRRDHHAVAPNRQQPLGDLFLRNLYLTSILHLDRARTPGITLTMAQNTRVDRIAICPSACSLLCNREAND